MTVVSVEHLTKKYSNQRGVTDISFSISKGEVLGLLGPNGSGKTTIMKMLAGLLKPGEGKIQLFNLNPGEDNSTIMAKTGCMIEQPGLYQHLNAEQNLYIVSRFYPNLNQNRIDEMLELVGLTQFRHEKVQKFSMGMKQRLAFAAALLPKPELLILDEPGNGMDIAGMALLRRTLKYEAEEGCAILISSHLANEMEQLCSHALILEEGTIIDSASVDSMIIRYGSLEKYYLSIINTERRKVDESQNDDFSLYRN